MTKRLLQQKFTLVALLTLLFSVQTYAMEKANIQVSASSSIEAMPDSATIHMTIEHSEKSKAAAEKKNQQQLSELITALAIFDIGKEEIDASEVNSYSQTRWHDGQSIKVGETVRNSITITVKNLEQIPALYQSLNKLNLARINSAQYRFSDIEALKNQAIEKALSEARDKADNIAKNIDRQIKSTFQVVVNDSGLAPVYRAQMMEAKASNIDNHDYMQTKAQKIQAHVQVIYLLK
jgi:uncharacterized protein YggE